MSPAPTPKPSQPRTMLLVVGVLAMVALLLSVLSSNKSEFEEVKWSEFSAALENPDQEQNRIVEVSIQGDMVTGTRQDRSQIRTRVPYDSELLSRLEKGGAEITFKEPESENFLKLMMYQLPGIILFIFLAVLLIRTLQAGGGKALSFGKSKAKLVNEDKPKVTFADIAGIDEAKYELEEIIEFLKEPKKFTKLGGRIPKGVLLIGPPGTGKTILAKGVAGEAGVPFFSISGSDFVEMFVGVGASRVRDLFDQAKKNSPCIVFIDEIDAVGRYRGAGMGGGHDEREQTLNQLLVEMDGFEANEGVIVVAATNRADVLDPALLRPGRFDRRVNVPVPDIRGRKGILEVHSRRTPLAEDVDLAVVAQATPGFTGADLENLINEAALIAARQNCTAINMSHCETAKDKVLMGAERKSMIMTETEKRNTAYHEAGHALVGVLSQACDPVHKVTIIPRGGALGVTIMFPSEDRFTMDEKYAYGMILYAMGGRAAEELFLDMQSSGAGNDILKATDIARKMVCNWGMSKKIGPLAIGKKEDEAVFMGRGVDSRDAHSDSTAQIVDEEIQRLVTSAYDEALQLLRDNKGKLVALAEALLIKETLNASEIDRVINGENIVTEAEEQAYKERKTRSENWAKENSAPVQHASGDLDQGRPQSEIKQTKQALSS